MTKKSITKKTTRLKNIIGSSNLEFLMEAHNGITSILVEEAGFDGIWASGLAISASLGVRDNNEASWTQILDVLDFMSDATSIPILLDGDTGFGNFNNMRRLVKKLEQRHIAGVCIEDKLFPKTNSFIGGEMQPLADLDEFCGKIKAAKDTQNDKDFCLVARTEAFIAGLGKEEALKRADAYCNAGADAILVHSKKNSYSDIVSFMNEWDDKKPIIIVPTKYYSTPTEKFEDLGISVAIWANQTIRTTIQSVRKTLKKIYANKNISCVEDEISTVSEIFSLQGADELKKAEKRYLPTNNIQMNTIILAASKGDLGEHTKHIPKTMLNLENDKTILSTQIETFNKIGIKDITVVRGFAKNKINYTNINKVDNVLYAESKELHSLYLAKNEIKENTIISFGDILFKEFILNELLNDKNDITIVVDSDYNKDGSNIDYVNTSLPYSRDVYDSPVELLSMFNESKNETINGEFIGLWKVSGGGANALVKSLEILSEDENFLTFTSVDLFNYLIKYKKIYVKYVRGGWLDIDTIIDLQNSRNF
tara:strand:+ start:1258 stop:2871 length:1614 start_codon:yes stop_codon:yes gene_type:complete